MREKGKPQIKLKYKIFNQTYVYDPLIDISPFPIPNKLTYFLGGIQHCVTVVGKCIFDRNVLFLVPLTCDDLY